MIPTDNRNDSRLFATCFAAIDRPWRLRSLGEGQIDFRAIFSKLAQYDHSGWAVLE